MALSKFFNPGEVTGKIRIHSSRFNSRGVRTALERAGESRAARASLGDGGEWSVAKEMGLSGAEEGRPGMHIPVP